jgi:VanZ family protein
VQYSNHWTRTAHALPALVMAGAIFYFSSLEKIDLPLGEIAFNDLLLHWAAYLVFGVTLLIAVRPSERLREKPAMMYATVLAIGAAYALSDEIHQYFVPNRSCSPADFIADTVGVLSALVGRHLLWRRWKRRER